MNTKPGQYDDQREKLVALLILNGMRRAVAERAGDGILQAARARNPERDEFLKALDAMSEADLLKLRKFITSGWRTNIDDP
ncbi:hypothetical protein [Sorangium sp. So ce1182]|uniref:hypothetical protein n=1 Tax=Sorangium sp. So ce1182 TaxID=3133334 RepID=UPI003F610576